MIGRIAKWLGIPDPRVIAAVALIWAASLGGLWAYMAGRATIAAEAAASVAKAEARADCSAAAAKAAEAARDAQIEAVKAARAAWEAAQAEVDRLAAQDRERIERDLVAARIRADNLFRTLQAHIHAKPLPVDCRLDAERVRLYNAARRNSDTAPD